MSFLHPQSLGLSRGHFYFAQRGHYHFAASAPCFSDPPGLSPTRRGRSLNANGPARASIFVPNPPSRFFPQRPPARALARTPFHGPTLIVLWGGVTILDAESPMLKSND